MFEYVGPPLTRQALAVVLEKNGVSERAYDLFGAHKHDALVLDHRPQGWIVFYSERGGEGMLGCHETEAEACSELLGRLLRESHNRFELVAGPAPPAEADAAFGSWLEEHQLSRSDLASHDLKIDEVPWARGQPLYRRYFVHRKRIQRRS